MVTAHSSVADIRPWQLGQPREQLHHRSWVEKMSFSSSNCRFPRPCLVAAIIFPHTKWLPKITDYRDTAALKFSLFDCCWIQLFLSFPELRTFFFVLLSLFSPATEWSSRAVWAWRVLGEGSNHSHSKQIMVGESCVDLIDGSCPSVETTASTWSWREMQNSVVKSLLFWFLLRL